MTSVTLCVDTHVHLHPGVAIGRCLDIARRNFGQWGGDTTTGVNALLLTESPGTHRFGEMSDADTPDVRWRVTKTPEGAALRAQHEDGFELYVVAGRQIPADGRFEVLGLGLDQEIEVGMAIGDTVDEILKRGGVAVLPWGFGKWLGARGRRLEQLLDTKSRRPILLGDNGGRPGAWPEPRQFDTARQKGIPVVAGSDPFPLPGEEERIASYGSVLSDVRFDAAAPATSILDALRELRSSPPTFGGRARFAQFVRAQVGLRRKGIA